MYGIEYSALADLYSKEGEKEEKTNDDSAKNNAANKRSLKNLNSKILDKLNALKECPEYLLPKFFSSTGTGTGSMNSSSASSVSGSKKAKSGENTSKSVSAPIYYTDDFILLSEFSEIEGPKPLLTIPTDGATAFNKNEYSLHCKIY